MLAKNYLFSLFLFFGLLIPQTSNAVNPKVQQAINEGNAFLNEGNLFSAEKMYVNAKGIAADLEDWDGLLLLTDRFLHVKSEYHAHDSHYLAHDFAETICTFAKESTNAVAECQRGMSAMNQCIISGQGILANLTMSTETATKIQNTINIAIDNLRIYREKGCPR